jgi:hypothetical protein
LKRAIPDLESIGAVNLSERMPIKKLRQYYAEELIWYIYSRIHFNILRLWVFNASRIRVVYQ